MLVVINPLNYTDAVGELVKVIHSRQVKGIYVTLNKPYKTLKNQYEKDGVDTKALFFIDGITDMVEETEDHINVGSVQDLSSLSIAISKVVSASKEKCFLLFDSLSTLLVYNDPKTVARFAHILTSKLRGWDLQGILLSVAMEQERDVIAQLTQFCDKTIRMG